MREQAIAMYCFLDDLLPSPARFAPNWPTRAAASPMRRC